MTIDKPKDIRRFHMLSQLHALRMEGAGLRFKGGSVLAHVKRSYGLKGNRQAVAIALAGLINGQD